MLTLEKEMNFLSFLGKGMRTRPGRKRKLLQTSPEAPAVPQIRNLSG